MISCAKSSPAFVLLTLCVLCACSRAAAPPEEASLKQAFDSTIFDEQKAYEEVDNFVALGPKPAGTEEGRLAAEYIRDRLISLGVSDAKLDVFDDDSPDGRIEFRNVMGRIPGRKGDKTIMLASHFDTKVGIKGFVGANDSGSSTGILLELARVLASQERIDADIVFAFFDGEECKVHYGKNDGLHGSRYLASKMHADGSAKNVIGFILLDMVGDKDLTVTIPRNSSAKLVDAALQAAHAEGARQKFQLYPLDVGDDHVPFLEIGVPAIDLIDFQFGSRRGYNDYWHTEQDTMDKISPESLGIVGRVTVRMINKLLEQTRSPGS